MIGACVGFISTVALDVLTTILLRSFVIGDGIMSTIDFEIDIQKKSDPNGDRVVVTYNGKFLPYRKW